MDPTFVIVYLQVEGEGRILSRIWESQFSAIIIQSTTNSFEASVECVRKPSLWQSGGIRVLKITEYGLEVKVRRLAEGLKYRVHGSGCRVRVVGY
jgi:hypothetical protein